MENFHIGIKNFNKKLNVAINSASYPSTRGDVQKEILEFAESLAIKHKLKIKEEVFSPEFQDVQEYSRQLETKLSSVWQEAINNQDHY